MKKAIKVFIRFFSLATFATLVFVGGLLGRFTRGDQDNKQSNKLPQGLFLGFDPNVAHADAPLGPGDAGPGVGPGGDSPAPCDSGGDGPGDC
jgi:hypothetical protein